MERIFEEFQQVGTSHLQEGTGLGLAISRRFVELHGGTLRSRASSGSGSTFTVTLPRTSADRRGDRQTTGRVAPSGAERSNPRHTAPRMTTLADGQLVLIIEDNEKNLKLARDLLRYHGFRTIEAL